MATVVPASTDLLSRAGLSEDEVRRWQNAEPALPSAEDADHRSLRRDAEDAARYFGLGADLLGRLPARPSRSPDEQAAAAWLIEAQHRVRVAFLRAYAEVLYRELTDDYRRFVRAEPLVYAAADLAPGLVPDRAGVAAEASLPQKDKDGLEIAQGLFFCYVLSHPRAGGHLVHAMLRPTEEAEARLADFQRDDYADLGTAEVRREGRAGVLALKNTRFLNAEDDSTTLPLEIGVDLLTLDPAVEVGVLRGAPVTHPRYAGRRVFNAGLNLTHLYWGRIPFLFFITRDLGFVNKLYRGLSGPEYLPLEPESTTEIPWVAAVEAFAIGGGCQILLVMDRVLAEAGSFFNLPARKEGIIPGAANLRLTRFVGDRLARQGILFDRRFEAESPEGRMLCDEIVPAGEMDAAIARTVDSLTGSGLVSAAGNRKALRVGQEPVDQFRAYMATYAREQAYCHFSPALIRNLEENWGADRRRP